jgi:hypothetical protein
MTPGGDDPVIGPRRRELVRTLLSAGLIVLCTPPAEGQSRLPRELGNFPVAINTVSTGEVLVSWQPVQKASAYEMERCEGAALTTCAMKTTPSITAGQPLQVRDNLIASGTYLYRVTAYGSKQLPIAQGQVGYVYTAPLTVVLMPAPSGTITPTPAGPAQLSAISPVPGQIHLSWSHVPSATRYRVFRTIVGSGPERELAPPGTDPSGNTPDRYIDAPVDLRWIYSYKVLAYVKPGATEIPTTPSPLATRKSLPFVQVSGLAHTVVPSTRSPGRLNVTVSWPAVKDVENYVIWDETQRILASGLATSYTESSVAVGRSVTVCVSAQYPYNVAQYTTVPCLVITT